MLVFQCLVSTLTQRGRWRTLFFFFRLTCSVALRGGREGCCKQNTGVCSQRLSHTGSAPSPFTVCVASLPTLSGSRLLLWEPSVAGPGLPALPGPSRSGSGTQVVLRGADSRLGLRFVPFPDPSSSGDEVFGARDCCDLSPPRHSVI